MKLTHKAMLFAGLFAFFTQGYCDDSTSQEAMSACADKEDGVVCEFTNKEGTLLNGFCRVTASSQGKLVCIPSQ